MEIDTIMELREIQDREARILYADMLDFFSSERKKKMLISLVSAEDVLTVLVDLETHFTETEEYEKCEIIDKWISEIVPLLDGLSKN